MIQDSFIELLKEATAMLLDRPKPEQDLIYYIARMESDLRAAIILAYQNLYRDEDV